MPVGAGFGEDLLVDLHVEANEFEVRGDARVDLPIIQLDRTVCNAIVILAVSHTANLRIIL